jgi:uridine kinase
MKIILIAGCSGSGKTTLAARLLASLGSPSCGLINLDSYYRDLSHLPLAEREQNNFDHPESLEHELLLEHLDKLLNSQSISIPLYDFKCHIRDGSEGTVTSKPIMLVEGIHALYWPKLRELAYLKIFVDTALDVCLERRLERDQRERGRSQQSVINQWQATVEPMFTEFALPMKSFADLHIEDSNIDDSVNRIIELL